MKKIISLFLAVLMLAGSCTAFAASNEDASAQGQDFSQAGFRYVSPWPDLKGELCGIWLRIIRGNWSAIWSFTAPVPWRE